MNEDKAAPEISAAMRPGHPIALASLERLAQIGEELFHRNGFQYLGNSVEEIREMREERLKQLLGESS